jgi:hypothetical protein
MLHVTASTLHAGVWLLATGWDSLAALVKPTLADSLNDCKLPFQC